MKMRVLWAVGATLTSATTANAIFQGITWEDYTGPGWAANGFSGLTAWRIYADFDNPADMLLAVFGPPGNPMWVNSSNGAFFNSAIANSLTAPMPLFPAIWSNQWDTYVTIGLDTSVGDATGLTPGFEFLVGGLAGNFSADGLAWFITPDDPQGIAGNYAGGSVLIAQFVVAEGEWIEGVVSLQFGSGELALDQHFTTPVPGTLALGGLAGLTAVRRRR